MKEIPLTQGLVALVDDEDFDRLSRFKWFASRYHNQWYAMRNAGVAEMRRVRKIRMHREVLGLPNGDVVEVDHRNLNGLDNRKGNLRAASRGQNSRNIPKRELHMGQPPSSRYKGIYLAKHCGLWRARISLNRKLVQLGYFSSEMAAAQAYDEAALKYHGEFACLNFPQFIAGLDGQQTELRAVSSK